VLGVLIIADTGSILRRKSQLRPNVAAHLLLLIRLSREFGAEIACHPTERCATPSSLEGGFTGSANRASEFSEDVRVGGGDWPPPPTCRVSIEGFSRIVIAPARQTSAAA